MSRLQQLAAFYEAAQDLATGRTSVELVSLADPTASHLNELIRGLTNHVQNGDMAPLADLVACARSLRWHLLTDPAPFGPGTARSGRAQDLAELSSRYVQSVDPDLRPVLEKLASLSKAVRESMTPPAGTLLLESLEEIGLTDCIVVLASTRAAHSTEGWFRELGLSVPVATSRQHVQLTMHGTAFYIGPPSLFGPVPTTAPRAWHVSYLFGSWVRDRSLPRPRIAAYVEGSSAPRSRLYKVGDQPRATVPPTAPEDSLLLTPLWPAPEPPRAPQPDEVTARKVLLSGGLSIMLDGDGELIRTFNPSHPVGDRVELRPVAHLAPGSYLVLREGETGREALYERALSLLGEARHEIESTQGEWKSALQQQLHVRGVSETVQALRQAGLKAAGQASAWTARTVARPQRDEDFRLLLTWLDLEPARYLPNASRLRRSRSQAMADIREQLESALADADMAALERDGFLRIAPGVSGFAGITATRVLAISPHEVLMHKHAVRIPQEDRSARWLE
ncbi:hypothetical protein ACF1BR_04400 [Streptomyces rubiginosohelvolus]|uniref:hypothetical protein n=1 Tax=Streptomyces rubiginosohelvolus TaxID=67362 RepID=UPI0037006DCB